MFHSQSLVSRNGPLRNIWMAAYYFRKLKKQQIADTDITFSVDKLLLEVQITYRMLAQLLLGIVRIFSKKVDYLYHDCNKALTNITISFNPTQHTVHKKSTSRSQNAQKKANGSPEDKAVVAKQVVSVSKNGFSTMQMEMIHSACNNVTVTLSDCSQNSQKKGHGGPQDNAAVAKEVVSISKSGIPTMQMEMLRSHHNVTITLPDCFELDAFDLEVEDGGSADISNKKTVHEDVWTSEKDQYSNSFLIEEHYFEDIYDEHIFSCFSPMEDVIPCNIMDLEIIKSYSSESTEAKRMIVEGLQYPEEPENNDGHCLHDEHAAENINLVKLRDRMSLDIERELQIGEQKNEVEPTNSCETKPSHSEEFHDVAERNSDARTSGGARDKSNITLDPGLPSPKFAVVTPKTRKEHRLFRKRKILFDDKIVLSNETMRTWIHDASDLVYKRRKAPHTSLDVWKAYQISNLHQSFMMEPLFPYISLEHKANLHDNSSAYLLHKRDTSLFIGNVDVRCETSSEVRLKESSPLPAIFSEISTPDRSEVRMKEMSPIEIPASDVDMMDLDVEFFEKEISDQDTGWSVKTRAVAKYLLERFLSCRDQRREEILNLAQVLRGQSRAKSAKFFYDTLTLTTHQCIGVKQDFPYSDIILSPTPLLWGYVAKSIGRRHVGSC